MDYSSGRQRVRGYIARNQIEAAGHAFIHARRRLLVHDANDAFGECAGRREPSEIRSKLRPHLQDIE